MRKLSAAQLCRYHKYLKEARSAEIFIRICNHNYLLADAARRLQEMRPLLNDYRALVIDEAHKLPDAARQMYGNNLSAEDFSELCTLLAKDKYILAAQRLREKFCALMGAMYRGELLEEAQRTAFVLTAEREAALRDCLSFLRQIQKQLAPHLPRWIIHRLGTTEQALNLFYTADRRYILYIQYDRAGSPSLCATSREMPERLRRSLWQLVEATHGHTLVLFTSYSLMGAVYNQVKDRLSFPLMEVWRHSQDVIHQFKQAQNAVLFAAGSCWEGVDFPGDMVSSLIIVRLPFPVPDPVSEAEREQYPTLQDYIKTVVIPDMQVMLGQGFGRAIRTETDTSVVSILDSRAAPGEQYHRDVLEALPPLRFTRKIEDVENFIRSKKGSDYFMP
ncbi:MAG: ATP-dependent DNA helicase [Hydrogeniiclostridium mannosilyticum]